MKVIKVELLEANNKNTVGYISKALKAIKENPKNHGYSTDEVERILKFEKEFNDAIKPFEEAIKSVSKIFTDLKKTILKFDISFDFFVQQFQQISQTGWFLSPDLIKRYTLDEIIELNTNKSSKNRDDLILQRHGKQSDVEKIVNHLKNTFPNRVAIMNEINRCYDLELFSSVITLCYSQADGICNEIWSFGFFDKNQKDDYKSKLYLELNNHEFGVSSHFITQLGIDENEIIRYSKDSYFNDPSVRDISSNRHLVMHGLSTNYGTKANALRAILLLNFIEHFVIAYLKGNEK